MSADDLDLGELIETLQERSSTRPSSTGLGFNPFPVTGIGDSREGYLLGPVDKSVVEAVRDFLLTALGSNEFTSLLVVGDYGFGKTHLLRWLQQVLADIGSKLPDGPIGAYYVPNPGLRPIEILMAVVRAIGQEEFRKMLWAIVASDLRERCRKGGTAAVTELFGFPPDSLFPPPEKTFEELMHEDSLASLPAFLQRFRASSLPPRALREYASAALNGLAPNLDVIRALTSVVLDDEMAAFTSWLSLSSAEAGRPLRVPQQDYFSAILSVLRKNGYQRVFLLIDEFEDVVGTRLSKRQAAEYLATLRLLIDEHLDDFSLVVAMVPAAWEETKKLHPPVADRMEARKVDLRPLDTARAIEIVRRYLNRARAESAGGLEDGTVPFSTDAIAAVLEASGRNTRAFVSACYRVLEHCWEEDEISGAAARAALAA